jgi:hypothetical protein
MPSVAIDAGSPADRLLAAGLDRLSPIVDELYDGILVIGGLAVTAWLQTHPTGIAVRTTRDIDLGIDRAALHLTTTSNRLPPLLAQHGFRSRPDDEPSRFVCPTQAGDFLVDLLLPKGASRSTPPEVEPGITTVAAPGLAYALERGPAPLDITVTDNGDPRTFHLPVTHLDAMLVMKAGLVATGTRPPSRAITDTADAVLLAAACTQSPAALDALRTHRRKSEPRTAIGWFEASFDDPTQRHPRRVGQHFRDEHNDPNGATWAVDAVQTFLHALNA